MVVAIAIIGVVLTVGLALGLIALVAISSGQVKHRSTKWDSVIETASQHLNGEGPTPEVFKRLDRKDPQPHR